MSQKNNKSVLVTGSAGFIGAHLVESLLKRGDHVVGIDNHNDYYDQSLKEARVERFIDHKNYNHHRISIEELDLLKEVFKSYEIHDVVNLAAQAGVRHSIEFPKLFIETNIMGFQNILELSSQFGINHLVYASSSSVYGANQKTPYSVTDSVDHPVSNYAMSKKSNELMAHVYSHLYNLPTTGLRYFTVYGPFGRPDMAMYKFTENIINGNEIEVYNHGKHKRDFTYISDIIEGTIKALDNPPVKRNADQTSRNGQNKIGAPSSIFNIGNNKTVELEYFISLIEKELGIKAKIKYLPMQKGDTLETFADIDDFIEKFNYRPSIDIETGVKKFIDWYKGFYKL